MTVAAEAIMTHLWEIMVMFSIAKFLSQMETTFVGIVQGWSFFPARLSHSQVSDTGLHEPFVLSITNRCNICFYLFVLQSQIYLGRKRKEN